MGQARLDSTCSGPFLPARHGPQQVGQAVEVRHHQRALADGLGHGQALGAAHDGAGQIEGGGHAVLPRHGEVARHVEAGQQVVDPRLQRGHHVRRHQAGPRLELRAVLRGGGHLRHQDVEVAGQRDQSVVDLGARRRLGPGHADGGLGLVDHAVQLDPPASPCAPARRRAGRSSRRHPAWCRSVAPCGGMLPGPVRGAREATGILLGW